MAKRQSDDAPAPQPDAPDTAPVLELLADAPAGPVREGELANALQDEQLAGGGGITPPDAPAESTAPPAADAPRAGRKAGRDVKAWSASRMARANRKEMRARIRQLEELAANPPAAAPAGGPDAPGTGDAPAGLPVEALEAIARDSITKTLAIVGGIAKRVRGDHWELTGDECSQLGSAWAPVLAPHLGGLAAHLPLVAALAVTGSIVWPRIERDMELATLASAERLTPTNQPAVADVGE